MAGEKQQQAGQGGSTCSCKFSSTEAMFIMNILDLFVAICMVWRGVQLTCQDNLITLSVAFGLY